MYTDILDKIAFFVDQLLTWQLSTDLTFHNKQHTKVVVQAAKEIALEENLSDRETAIVIISAWFHDTGYCYRYNGHEEFSALIAKQFLRHCKLEHDLINSVIGCIEATKIPQNPKTHLESILCDADMYHCSAESYFDLGLHLKREWAVCLNKTYSDEEWMQLTFSFLTNYHFHTAYGKRVLEKRKAKNIERIAEKMQ